MANPKIDANSGRNSVFAGQAHPNRLRCNVSAQRVAFVIVNGGWAPFMATGSRAPAGALGTGQLRQRYTPVPAGRERPSPQCLFSCCSRCSSRRSSALSTFSPARRGPAPKSALRPTSRGARHSRVSPFPPPRDLCSAPPRPGPHQQVRVIDHLLTHPEQFHCGACQAAAMAIWWAMLTAASPGLSEHAATSMAMLLLTVNAR